MIHLINLFSNKYSTVMGNIIEEFHEMQHQKDLGNTKEAKHIKAGLNKKIRLMGLKCPNPDCRCQTEMGFFSCYVRGLDEVENAEFAMKSKMLEIVRAQCGSCKKTQALLPCDVIPYSRASVDTVLLAELTRQRVSEELEQSKVFADKTVPENPAVGADEADPAQSTVPADDMPPVAVSSTTSVCESKTLREKLVIKNGHVFIDGIELKKGAFHVFTDNEGFTISLSTVYRWGKAFSDEAHQCFNYCDHVLRNLDLWNKGKSPSLGELCALLLTNPFSRIQKELIRRHNCPFLFRLSRRTVSRFPVTGYSSCTLIFCHKRGLAI